jgi:hypothetical protein
LQVTKEYYFLHEIIIFTVGIYYQIPPAGLKKMVPYFSPRRFFLYAGDYKK